VTRSERSKNPETFDAALALVKQIETTDLYDLVAEG